MNRKKKINDLYKGVFKNDKKGCLVDLKPLDNRQEICIAHTSPPKQYNNNNYQNQCNQPNKPHYPKQIDISLKVAKNLGFGTYFKNLREDILDVFLGKEDLISFESMFHHKDVSDLFNFKESVLKTNATTQIGQGKTKSSINNNNNFRHSHISNHNNNNMNNSILNQINQSTNSTDQEVILYEDEEKTIFKRKKMRSKLSKENEQQGNNTCYISVAQENVNNVKPMNRNSIGYYPYQNYNMNTNTNMNQNVPTNSNTNQNMNMNVFNPMNDYNKMNKGMFTPNKNDMALGNNFTKNSVLFMNRISNCRHINENYLSIPNISHN